MCMAVSLGSSVASTRCVCVFFFEVIGGRVGWFCCRLQLFDFFILLADFSLECGAIALFQLYQSISEANGIFFADGCLRLDTFAWFEHGRL